MYIKDNYGRQVSFCVLLAFTSLHLKSGHATKSKVLQLLMLCKLGIVLLRIGYTIVPEYFPFRIYN